MERERKRGDRETERQRDRDRERERTCTLTFKPVVAKSPFQHAVQQTVASSHLQREVVLEKIKLLLHVDWSQVKLA